MHQFCLPRCLVLPPPDRTFSGFKTFYTFQKVDPGIFKYLNCQVFGRALLRTGNGGRYVRVWAHALNPAGAADSLEGCSCKCRGLNPLPLALNTSELALEQWCIIISCTTAGLNGTGREEKGEKGFMLWPRLSWERRKKKGKIEREGRKAPKKQLEYIEAKKRGSSGPEKRKRVKRKEEGRMKEARKYFQESSFQLWMKVRVKSSFLVRLAVRKRSKNNTLMMRLRASTSEERGYIPFIFERKRERKNRFRQPTVYYQVFFCCRKKVPASEQRWNNIRHSLSISNQPGFYIFLFFYFTSDCFNFVGIKYLTLASFLLLPLFFCRCTFVE